MSSAAEQALKLEAEFLAGVESNFEGAKGKQFRGSAWRRSEADEVDRLKGLMATHQRYDRALLKSMPGNRRVAIHGFERRLLLWKRRTGVAVASVLTPLEHWASGAESAAPPIGLGELIDHVRRLAGDSKVTHVIGVCCPTGLTPEARAARLDMPNAAVVLIEPDGQGGWNTCSAGGPLDEAVLRLFDPEGGRQKIDRVRRFVDSHSADLLTGGLTASKVAASTHLPEHIVRRAMDEIAAADPELRATRKEGQLLLYRGAPARRQERASMNVIDRIRQLFSGEGDETEKINLLAERRATLAQRRDRIYEDIGKLEEKEADLLKQGKAATSAVPKRRLAAQLLQVRKDVGRLNTTAAMLAKQIDIISTDIHNLTLIRQGEDAKLPDTEQLTEHAVKAEEMLETLTANAELVSSLETGLEATLASDEEMAILKEFDEPEAAPPAQDKTRAKSRPGESARAADDQAEESPEPTSDATGRKSRRADAEPT